MSSFSSVNADAMRALSDVVSLTHVRLIAVIEATHADGGQGAAARRAVLHSVLVNCPMTVPQIAALRLVSRQYIQSIVDLLKAEGLVELIENPAHRRSSLVRPTPEGQQFMVRMKAREDPLLAAAAASVGASADELHAAADLLRQLNSHMDAMLATIKKGKPDEG